jgi:hypothetical protein
MSEHARLAEIEKEYESMGCNRDWVSNYVHWSTSHEDRPFHNGIYLWLPPGTMPHMLYMEKLTSLVQSMEEAEECAKNIKNTSEDVDKDQYVKRFGTHAYEQEMKRKAELRRHKLIRPKEIQHELRVFLTKSRPIDATAFREKMDALIREEIRLLVNIRIMEATAFNQPAGSI